MDDTKHHIDEHGVEWKRLFFPIQLRSNQHKSVRPKDELKGKGVRYITDKMAKEQGLKDANEYIESHNELQQEHAKKLPKTKKKFIE